MTVLYTTDHAEIENTIATWLRDFATFNDRIRVADQAGVRPATPYATYQIIADGAMEGIDSLHEEFNEDLDVFESVLYGPRRMTVQVVVYTEPGAEDVAGRGARVRLSGAIAALRSPKVRDLFFDAGLSFLQLVGAPLASDEQLGNRWERRMQADVELGYTSLVVTKGADDGAGYFDKLSIDIDDTSGENADTSFVVDLDP